LLSWETRSNMNHSLAAVASRIQERNNALCSELATLELLQPQCIQAEQCLKADEAASAKARRELLTSVRARHGLELERLNIEDESRKIDESVAEARKAAEVVRAETEELRRKFDEEQAPVFAAHDLKSKLHTMRSESTLVAAQRKKARREERLRDLRERTERQSGEAKEHRLEAQSVREGCEEMDRREEEDDEETVALGMQIKSVLAKVSKKTGLAFVRS